MQPGMEEAAPVPCPCPWPSVSLFIAAHTPGAKTRLPCGSQAGRPFLTGPLSSGQRLVAGLLGETEGL